MGKELDTSWFDLSKYDSLITFGLREWERQLSIRSYMWWCSGNNSDAFQEICNIWLEKIQTKPLISNYDGERSNWKNQHEYNPACFTQYFQRQLTIFGVHPKTIG